MSYTGKIEDLIAERDELRNALTAVSDALDYLHGLTPEQAGKLCKDAERYRKWRADYTGGEATEMLIAIADAWEPAQVDAAIDAAPAVGAA